MRRRLGPPLAAFLLLCACLAPFSATLRPAHAAQTPAYLALGDSISFGVGATRPASDGFVALTTEELRKSDRYKDRGLELVNLSAPGATSDDLLLSGGQLDRAVQEITDRKTKTSTQDDDVEVITVNIGGNDLLALASPGSPCSADAFGEACQGALGKTLSNVQNGVSQVISGLRQAAPSVPIIVLDLYNPYSGTGQPQEAVADIAVQQVNGVIRAAVSDPDAGVQLVSLYQTFQGRGKSWIAADGLHPNNNGHRVISELVLARIQGRAPAIPAELLAQAVAPTSQPSGQPAPGSADDSGGEPTWLILATAIPAAFIAGAVITGVYFLARGR